MEESISVSPEVDEMIAAVRDNQADPEARVRAMHRLFFDLKANKKRFNPLECGVVLGRAGLLAIELGVPSEVTEEILKDERQQFRARQAQKPPEPEQQT